MVPDLGDAVHVRCPLYQAAMLERGVCAVYALPVVIAGEYVGALELYRHSPGDRRSVTARARCA